MWWMRPCQGLAQPFDRDAQLAAHRRRLAGSRVDAEVVHRGGEPVLEVGVEAVLRLTGLQVEKAEDERAGEPEQRGREGYAHAAEGGREAFLEGFEHLPGIAPDLEALEHPADRGDRLDQAPKSAEQAEEHQEARHITRQVARLVQAVGDRIHDAAHGLRRHGHAADAVAQDRGHRCEQDRRAFHRKAGIGQAEAVDPGDFGKQTYHLAEGEDDAGEQHQHDQGVQSGVGEERGPDLLVENDDEQRAQGEEHHHADQKDPGRAHFERVDVVVLLRHGGSAIVGGGFRFR